MLNIWKNWIVYNFQNGLIWKAIFCCSLQGVEKKKQQRANLTCVVPWADICFFFRNASHPISIRRHGNVVPLWHRSRSWMSGDFLSHLTALRKFATSKPYFSSCILWWLVRHAPCFPCLIAAHRSPELFTIKQSD